MTDARPRGRPYEGERIAVRIPPGLLNDIDNTGAELGLTRAEMLRTILRDWQRSTILAEWDAADAP